MARIAGEYHNALQYQDIASQDERKTALERTIAEGIETSLSLEHYDELQKPLTKDNTKEVLKLSPNGKAVGIDGLPYEFWKWVLEKSQHMSKKEQEKEPFICSSDLWLLGCSLAFGSCLFTHMDP